MTPTQTLDVQLVNETGAAVRLEGVSISIGFFFNGNYRYAFRLGPTDENGHLRVSYADVEQRRLLNLKEQPWDYKTRLDECDPVVRLSVPSQDELNEAAKIATSFNMGVVPPDAEWWARANNRDIRCESTEVLLQEQNTTVSIVCV